MSSTKKNKLKRLCEECVEEVTDRGQQWIAKRGKVKGACDGCGVESKSLTIGMEY